MTSAAPAKDPITCHVLDTTTGRPAPGIWATLSFSSSDGPGEHKFSSRTDADGRISNWEAEGPTSLRAMFEKQTGLVENDSEWTMWTLKFDTDTYFEDTFWPEVVVRFWVKTGGTYHVPLLLGPYSYTVYRGS